VSPSKKEAAITALEQAEADFATAQDTHESARKASARAVAHAAEIRAQVASGATNVTDADLSASTAAAEFAALTLRGSAEVLPALSAKVAAARAEEAADEVVEVLPQLGLEVALALAGVEEALAPVVAACRHYDAYVETATAHLQTVARPPEDQPQPHVAPPTRGGTTESPFTGAGSEPATVVLEIPSGGRPRVSFPRFSHPRVDSFDLTSCRGPGQLAAVLLPAFRALNANESLIEGLKLLAAGAPQLPTPTQSERNQP
jgi:hypothetical protein